MVEKNIKEKLVKKTVYLSQVEITECERIAEQRSRSFAAECRRAIKSHIEKASLQNI